MMEVARRRFLLSAVCSPFVVALLAGCARKPPPAQDEKPSEATSGREAEGSKAGVGDVVDYLTGKTPLRVKKRAEEKLDRIAREREKQLEEFLDADDGPRPAREKERSLLPNPRPPE